MICKNLLDDFRNDTARRLYSILLACFMLPTYVLAEQQLPEVNSAVTCLYYKDLAAAENFYGQVLGFEKDFEGGWVKIFRAVDGGRVGIVDEKKGYLNTAENKPVMFSIDTPDVDAWYRRVLEKGENYIHKPLKPEADGFVRAFLLRDPGGYHVEFFQWIEKEGS